MCETREQVQQNPREEMRRGRLEFSESVRETDPRPRLLPQNSPREEEVSSFSNPESNQLACGPFQHLSKPPEGNHAQRRGLLVAKMGKARTATFTPTRISASEGEVTERDTTVTEFPGVGRRGETLSVRGHTEGSLRSGACRPSANTAPSCPACSHSTTRQRLRDRQTPRLGAQGRPGRVQSGASPCLGPSGLSSGVSAPTLRANGLNLPKWTCPPSTRPPRPLPQRRSIRRRHCTPEDDCSHLRAGLLLFTDRKLTESQEADSSQGRASRGEIWKLWVPFREGRAAHTLWMNV